SGVTGSARIAVRDTGLQYLTAAEVAPALGLPTAAVQSLLATGGLALSRGGQPVAWLADPTSKVSPAGFYFYGQTVESIFTLDTVYRLDRTAGVRMATGTVPPATATAGGAFTASQHSEKDLFPATLIASDPNADYWYWDFVLAGDPTDGSRTFALDAPSLASGGTASLTVSLQSATTSGVAGEHHALVSVNGTPVGDTTWQGIAAQRATFPVDPRLLQATGNQIAVTGELGSGVPYSIFYVDSFDLGYPRLYKSSGDALAFPSNTAPVTVTGFSTPAVGLFDVTDPNRPRMLNGATVDADPANAGTYRLSLGATAAGASYVATTAAGIKHPAGLRAWTNAGLSAAGRHADYLVIAAPDLKVAAKRLVSYRQGQGLDAQLVGLDEVGDEFGGGVATPAAVQSFLSFVRGRWSPAPRYVVLLGAGSLDFRNLLGYGDSLFPPFEVASPDGLFASDYQLAPMMAIGRIPAHSATDLSAYIDKLIAFEASGANAWDGTAVLLADEQDRGADFSSDSERVASQLGAISVTDRLYLSTTPLTTAHSRLLQDLATGTGWVDYVGHGAMDRLAAGGLLSSTDVPTLANSGRLPILTAMTCTVNRFDVPGIPALGESLTTATGVGAIAVLSPSGLAVAADSRLLAERFYRHANDAGLTRLGDLLLAARAEFRATGGAEST
ncbi:MAG TPA: C25 family cysteine peptidase, partial [Thermoanaerobaculia bacterium]